MSPTLDHLAGLTGTSKSSSFDAKAAAAATAAATTTTTITSTGEDLGSCERMAEAFVL